MMIKHGKFWLGSESHNVYKLPVKLFFPRHKPVDTSPLTREVMQCVQTTKPLETSKPAHPKQSSRQE